MKNHRFFTLIYSWEFCINLCICIRSQECRGRFPHLQSGRLPVPHEGRMEDPHEGGRGWTRVRAVRGQQQDIPAGDPFSDMHFLNFELNILKYNITSNILH